MSKQTDAIARGPIFPLVVRLTIPAVVAQLITFLYNIVDRMYVAGIPDGGMDALAALGIVLPVTLILTSLAHLVGLGGAPRAGIRMGEKNLPEANRIFGTAFVLLCGIGLFAGVVTFLFARRIVILFGCPASAAAYAESYLKLYACGSVFAMLSQGMNPFILTQGYSGTAMASVLCGAICNIVLDPVFIYACDMGVAGSALATMLSQMLSCVCVIGFFFTKKSLFRLKLSDMRLRAARIGSILSLGVTPFVMTITECAIQIVFNVCLNHSTGGNSDYTAALTVMLTALQLISLPLNGIGHGMQPFVSYNYGSGDEERLKRGIGYATILAFAYCVTVWSFSMTHPAIYARLFSASASVEEIVAVHGPRFLFGSIFFFVQMTLQNINVALGQAKSALCLAVMRKVVILIPLCVVLTHFLGYRGVYLSEGIADLVAGSITACVIGYTFPRIFHRRAEEVRAKREDRKE